ncbi:MAG: ankyrin repeat domain-containing protein [Phycisphaerales bacterium]
MFAIYMITPIATSIIQSHAYRFSNGDWISSFASFSDDDPDIDYKVQLLEHVLKQEPWLVNSRDSRGLTPLGNAAEMGFLKSSEVLLRFGADPSRSFVRRELMNSKREKWTALALAIENGHQEIARVLIEAGADIGKIETSALARNDYGSLNEFLSDTSPRKANLPHAAQTERERIDERIKEDTERLWYGPKN